MMGGAELLASPRGTDLRLDDYVRPTRDQKREDYLNRKEARAAARAELEAERKAGIWTESVNYKQRQAGAPVKQEDAPAEEG